jgi:hypothetical protein
MVYLAVYLVNIRPVSFVYFLIIFAPMDVKENILLYCLFFQRNVLKQDDLYFVKGLIEMQEVPVLWYFDS